MEEKVKIIKIVKKCYKNVREKKMRTKTNKNM